MTANKQKVFDELDRLEITYGIIDHPAVFTIDEMDSLHIDEKGEILKNLFLRDNKGKRYFLVSIKKEKRARLDELQRKLDCGRLSFASEQKLMELLGLEKGSVTPLGILNDESRKVEYVLDADIAPEQCIGVHPNVNTATVWLAAKDLERVIKEHGNSVAHIRL
jgi:Ala-tRNA(Pro) deacylase